MKHDTINIHKKKAPNELKHTHLAKILNHFSVLFRVGQKLIILYFTQPFFFLIGTKFFLALSENKRTKKTISAQIS